MMNITLKHRLQLYLSSCNSHEHPKLNITDSSSFLASSFTPPFTPPCHPHRPCPAVLPL